MGHHGFLGEAVAFTEDDGADEGGDAGADMDDCAAGEVEDGDGSTGGPIEEAAFTPDHVAEGQVDEGGPEEHENDVGAEAHAFGDGATDEGGGNDDEHHLEEHEALVGDGAGVVGIGGGADIVEEEVGKGVAEEGVPFGEGGAVAERHPEEGHESHEDEAVHHGGEDVLASDEAAIEEDKAGGGHHEDEGGADEHPAIVTGIDSWRGVDLDGGGGGDGDFPGGGGEGGGGQEQGDQESKGGERAQGSMEEVGCVAHGRGRRQQTGVGLSTFQMGVRWAVGGKGIALRAEGGGVLGEGFDEEVAELDAVAFGFDAEEACGLEAGVKGWGFVEMGDRRLDMGC
jgi:hypothetical protein